MLIGRDASGARASLPSGLPVLPGELVPGPELAALANGPVLAFAGIGRPQKFFDMLSVSGVRLVRAVPFPDHHRFRPAELARLAEDAGELGARLVTTPKDHVRLDQAWRARVACVGVSLRWADKTIEMMLDEGLAG